METTNHTVERSFYRWAALARRESDAEEGQREFIPWEIARGSGIRHEKYVPVALVAPWVGIGGTQFNSISVCLPCLDGPV